MATAVKRMTVADLEKLPEREKDGSTHELHHGELVYVSPPKFKHILIQRRIQKALEVACQNAECVFTEFPFRLGDSDLRIADVAYVSQHPSVEEIFAAGSPELVVEIPSPSNSLAEMDDREQLCFQHGCVEFWLVNPERRTTRVTTRNAIQRLSASDRLTCSLFPGW